LDTRAEHREIVLSLIKTTGRMSTTELSQLTRLSRTTLHDLIRGLEADGLISRVAPPETGKVLPGRPPVWVAPSSAQGFPVGVDLGHYGIRASVFDVVGSMLPGAPNPAHVPLQSMTLTQTMSKAAELITEAVVGAGLTWEQVKGIGLSVPAPVDPRYGLVLSPSSLDEWPHKSLKGALSESLKKKTERDIPVIVENDANASVIGEHRHGVAQGRSDVLYIKVSKGIGLGMILGGTLHRGTAGTAGEFGHTLVEDFSRPGEGGLIDDRRSASEFRACDECKRKGCLKMLASGPSLIERLGGEARFSVEQIIQRALAEDKHCLRAVRNASYYLGRAVGGLVGLLDPEMVIIGGPLSRGGVEVLNQVGVGMGTITHSPRQRKVELVCVDNHEITAVRGAAAMVAEQL
jgi:predicted NBD/HSP70 family sugar kinase